MNVLSRAGFGLWAAAAGIAMPSNGQAAAPAIDELEEVVVTAQRREENAQTVAIAVTALGGEALDDKAVARLDDLQFASPALTITDAGLSRSVNIRGVGLASGSPAVTAGVATYVDGIFQPPIVTSTTYYDISAIEVLRGPQGTFVGSSSTGGAIFINSRDPELSGSAGRVQVQAGNVGMLGAEGMFNLPMGETFALRVAGNYISRDSHFSDLGPLGSQAGKLDEISGRLGMLWRPNDAFQALLKVEGGKRSTGGYAYRPIEGTTYAPLRGDDIRELSYDDATRNDEYPLQGALELRYVLNGGVTLRSLSGYQNKRVKNLYDMDATIQPAPPAGLAYPRVTQDQYVRERVWTQEFNVISPTDGRLDWVAGAYFQRNRIDVEIEQASDGFPTDIDIHNRKSGAGFFAQAGYKLTQQLKLKVGARYSTFDVSQEGSVVIGRGLPFPPFNTSGLQVADLTGSHDDGRPTGKVSLEWTPQDNQLLYAFVARGYKPGGFNSTTSEFDPETVLDYELGWKSTLMDGRLRTSVGAFWYDYSDFQLDLLDPGTGTVTTQNIADATVRGIEGSMQMRLGGWAFDVGMAWVDSELGKAEFINSRALPPGTNLPQCPPGTAPGVPPACFDYSPYVTSATGGPLLYAPEFTFNAGVEYTFALANSTLTPRVNYAHIGEQWTNLLYAPATDRVPSRGVLSALLSWKRDAWSVQAYGTNLADEKYVTGQFGNNEFYGAPREYGLRLAREF